MKNTLYNSPEILYLGFCIFYLNLTSYCEQNGWLLANYVKAPSLEPIITLSPLFRGE